MAKTARRSAHVQKQRITLAARLRQQCATETLLQRLADEVALCTLRADRSTAGAYAWSFRAQAYSNLVSHLCTCLSTFWGLTLVV
jgi:hypothetical protein